jgi:predicted amidophosphoribosyltransferase
MREAVVASTQVPISLLAPYLWGMICQGCHRFSSTPLCRECFSDLRPAPDRVLPGGIRAVAAFDHTGVAARLVHGFKYRGDGLLVALAVGALAERIEPGLTFVPVPRVWTRFVRYGVDPATLLARALAEATGGSVGALLRRPLHNPRRAGSQHRSPAPRFLLRQVLQAKAVVVDDVLTTGGTVSEAIKALRPASIPLVVTATSARQVSSLLVPVVRSHAGREVVPAGELNEYGPNSR